MFRVTIRDVLLLMVVVGILCAWWLEDARQYAAYRDLYSGEMQLKSQLEALARQSQSDSILRADCDSPGLSDTGGSGDYAAVAGA